MKTLKLILAAVLLTGVSTLAIAGPGAQYWTQQNKTQQDRSAQAAVDPACPTCSQCGCCAMMKK